MIMIPTYYLHYGPTNFLWFSDVGLFLIVLSVWFRSSFLISMSALITFFMEMIWVIDYLFTLLTGYNLVGMAAYMFNQDYSMFIRSLSLFHLFLPAFHIQYMSKWGYNPKALTYSIGLFWVILLACFMITPVDDNINYVFISQLNNWQIVTPYLWLSILMFSYPVLIMLPKNYCFQKVFNSN